MKIRTLVSLTGLVVGFAALADAAHADVFRCVSADGSVTFTDNEAACPKAQKHEALGRVQNLPSAKSAAEPSPAAPLTTQRLDRQQAAAEERARKQIWQEKKRAAEDELRSLNDRQSRLERVVTGCNRGSEIITRDSTGIKYKVPCSEIRQQHGENARKATELRDYLATGLRRECREAGCLPGWIR